MKKKIHVFLYLIVGISMNAQNDSIIGKIKTVREKVIYTDSIQNNTVLEFEEDYGHFGFSTPHLQLSALTDFWYHNTSVSYANYIRRYNEARQLINEEWFDKKDSLIYRFEYKYDEKGNRTQQTESNGREGDLTINNYGYDYKDLLKTKVRVYLDNPDVYFYTVYKYNADGKLIQFQNFNEYDETYGMKYEYDDKGRKIKDIQHSPFIQIKEGKSIILQRDETGTDHLSMEYFYDESSNLIQEKSYSEDDENLNRHKLQSTVLYTYDTQNRKIKSCRTLINPPYEYCTTYRYDRDNLLTEENSSSVKRKYKYVNGRISTLIYDSEIDDMHNWSKWKIKLYYEFDSHGNWIKQTKTIDGVPLYIRIRNIEYFH